MTSLSRLLLCWFAVLLLFTSSAQAQFEIRSGSTNLLDQRRASASVGAVFNGTVFTITVRNPGGGYTAPPLVTVAAPAGGGVTATATASISGGRVTLISVVNAGSGYDSNNFPAVTIAPPNPPVGVAPTTPQYAGLGNTSAIAGALSSAGIAAGRFPVARDVSLPTFPVVTVVLSRASFGHSFASGVPRYFMGDEIMRPLVRLSDNAMVPQSYWRSTPVVPGETFSSPIYLGSGAGTVTLPTTFPVTVTSSALSSPTVEVQSVPATLMAGATLLGRRVFQINGTTVTLSGNANQAISTPTSVQFSPYQPFYYSPHANRVFATEPGRITITWVSAAPDTSLAGETIPTFKFRSETFSVSSASRTPSRTMFWTEKSFTGPLIKIPAGRIVRVNPVFNSFLPPLTTEYVPVGSNENPATGSAPESRTVWFDSENGQPALHAYNAEGRIFIEYLGAEAQGSIGVHQFLGADILEVRRVAEVQTIQTPLGERLRPRQEAAQNGDDQLVPNVFFNNTQGQKLAYGSFVRPDGNTEYYAERESIDADDVTIFWLEPNDAAIHFLTPPSAPGLSINWPRFKRNYVLSWPTALAQFEPVNVTSTGATVENGPVFAAASLPQVIFQDDPQEREVEVDAQSQRLLVNFSASVDKTSRTLLKFTSSDLIFYVRLYIQSQDALGSPAVPDPDGSGPLVGTPAVFTINDLNADGIADFAHNSPTVGNGESGRPTTAIVGTRLVPPRAEYALAGHVTSGVAYSEAAYIDPLGPAGVEAAAAGAIIPVNTRPNRNLTVWWFKKITPPTARIAPFYVPAVAARYRTAFPFPAQQIVIASQRGVENPSLTSIQSAGSIYVQNDVTKIGYNPNEEHALVLAGNVYALRDDLNVPSTSEPYVLLQYTEPATGTVPARPAMSVFEVIRSNATYPLTYDKIAGTPLQPPLPLTALPLPLLPDGSVRNREVASAPDTAVGAGAPAAYQSFTFADRKGTHQVYRGPHNGGTPSFGMKFYYKSLSGFFIPGLATQPPVGTIMPFIGTDSADKVGGDSITLTYFPKWPDDPSLPVAMRRFVPVLETAQTLALQREELPQVRGQSSAQIVYQQSIANTGISNPAAVLHDPTRQKIVLLNTPGVGLAAIPPSVLTTDFAGKTYFQNLPPNLQQRFYFVPTLGAKGGLVLIGEFVDVISGEDYYNLNMLSPQDLTDLKALCPTADGLNKGNWDAAIDQLRTTLETFRESTTTPGLFEPSPPLDVVIGPGQRSDVIDPDTAVDSYALSSTGRGTGYVTLVFGNGKNPGQTDQGDPVQISILKVANSLFPGDIKVLTASNPLDEQVVLRHSGDYGGAPENFEFQWRYGFPVSGLPPLGDPGTSPNWIDPGGTLGGSILVGGSPTAVISAPAVLLGDTFFTMRYRNKPAGPWSQWLPPAFVPGWIKRVLAAINPFNQRVTDLFNTAVNTDVSLLTQAGTRWEGNIALNLNNINDAGLIEIYETVLNRGKALTIGSGYDFGPSNNALLLAAGYLNDLYTILGNEAFDDAGNPTISVDDQTTVTEVNTSRFSFESQVSSSLDEELALLRGRDDFGSPSVGLAPAYNRLFWNFTRGIDSGEVLYAVNYNIREKAGEGDGVVDATDAQRMFPQGHGDAYGHYLTSLTGYYKMLTYPQFTWIPQAESVEVLGQAVLIDYRDERKFAASASNLARTAQQMITLVHRQSYTEDTSAGWSQFRDGAVNPRTQVVRHQGLDETISRAAQGNYFHWITCNVLLPDEDTDPNHTGVQIVDRKNVPELDTLPAAASSFQTSLDLANAHVNPLGLSPGAIAFDLSPTEFRAGQSHYEQVYARALRTLNNAKGAFDQAARMTRLRRNQENQIAAQQEAIVDQEDAFVSALIEIYGKPYSGDIGPGKTFEQGYDGPDDKRWFIIDRPTDLVDTTRPVTVTLRVPTQVRGFTGNAIADIQSSYQTQDTVVRTFTITPNQRVQFADVVGPGTVLGSRPQTGALQQALLDAHLAQVALIEANQEVQVLQQRFVREAEIFTGLVKSHRDAIAAQGDAAAALVASESAAAVLEAVGEGLIWGGEAAITASEAGAEFLPTSVGLATDVAAPARGGIRLTGFGIGTALVVAGLASKASAGLLGAAGTAISADLESELADLGFKQEELQAAYEFEMLYRELVSQHYRFVALTAALQTANQNVANLAAAGESILLDRESFRKRAAAIITGFRTKDLTFRTFRSEALEQYRTLFDLASRYTYLAVKSYDYETGLLGSTDGRAVLSRIVASRALGDLSGGVPQATASTLGDAGLAGTLAQINADFTVAEGRLGINNPDPYGTLFSMRHEQFRILNDPSKTDDDQAWQQTLEQHIVANVLSDPDVAANCLNIRKPDGSPVPGFIIPFSTTIQHGKNFFGLDYAAGDHNYTPSSFATKISSVGIVLPGYVGMDPYAIGIPNAGGPNSTSPNALGATPYVYLIPCGVDYMLAPPLGDTNTVRAWTVRDQALPLPYNLGSTSFNSTQFFNANGTLSEQPYILRKHQAFRPVNDPAFFYSSIPAEFTNSRLIARSVWNSRWKIVIPAYTLLNNEQDGLNRFAASVKDIQLFLRTYSNSGN